MKRDKPILRVVGAHAATTPKIVTAVEAARRRHGKHFADDPGSTWKPSSLPILTAWLLTTRSKKDGAA